MLLSASFQYGVLTIYNYLLEIMCVVLVPRSPSFWFAFSIIHGNEIAAKNVTEKARKHLSDVNDIRRTRSGRWGWEGASPASQPYFSLFPVGRARRREKYVWTL